MKEFRGTRKLQSFAPNWSDPELLERTLIGREQLVDILEERAIDGAKGPNRHQRLVIGPRGSGKTHVIKVLHNRLWKNESIKKNLLIAYLIEDELGVASFLDFLVRVLRAIERWDPEKKDLSEGLEQMYELHPDAMEPHAVRLLLEEAGDRTILILMENLNVLFDNKHGFGLQGQKQLRDFVQQHGNVMIFATVQSLISGVQKRKAPFFGFFSITHLRELSLEEAGNFVCAMAEAYGKSDLKKFLNTPEGRGRIRAIYRFTGGNHRLLVTFFNFLTADSVTRLSEQFIEGLNPLRAYYQEQMRSLSAQQQKIVQYLSLEREPRTVKEIAKYCLATSNTVSKQLKELLNKRFVSRIPKGRDAYYELTETLFRIIYEADLDQEGAPFKLFVDFLSNFYTAKELQLRHMGYSLLSRQVESMGGQLFYQESLLYEHAIKTRLKSPEKASSIPDSKGISSISEPLQFFNRLAREKAYREIITFAPYYHQSHESPILIAEAKAHLELDNLETARERAELALYQNPEDPAALVILSGVYSKEEAPNDKALAVIRLAYDKAPNDPEAIENLGVAFLKRGDYEDALPIFDRLVDLKHDYLRGWLLKALTEQILDNIDKAFFSYAKALELDPDNEIAIEQSGNLLRNQGRDEEALSFFDKLVYLKPDYPEGWKFKALSEQNLGQIDEALSSYAKALELDPDNEIAIEQSGSLFWHQGRYEEALSFFDKLVDLKPDYLEGWKFKALVEGISNQIDNALSSYAKILELDPDNENAIEQSGILLGIQDRHEEALSFLDRLVELKPDYSKGWGFKADAEQFSDSVDKALFSYAKALELDPYNQYAILQAGLMVAGQGRYEEALSFFDKLVELNPHFFGGWLLKAFVEHLSGKTKLAFSSFTKTLEIDPNNADLNHIIGILLMRMGRYEEALFYIDKAMEHGASTNQILNTRGEIFRKQRKFKKAIKEYKLSLENEPDGIREKFHLASSLLGLNRIGEAKRWQEKAFESVTKSGDESLLTQSLHENVMALFQHTSIDCFSDFLLSSLDSIRKFGYENEFEQGLSLTVFELLKNRRDIERSRMEAVLEALEKISGGKLNPRIHIRFLRTGLDYFYHNDDKALLRLSREERETFMEELGIEG